MDKIKTDGKWCDTKCFYLTAGVDAWFCKKFERIIRFCLGGGPLRCAECLKGDKQ